MPRTIATLLAVVFLLASSASSALAGFVLTDTDGSTIMIQDNHVRMESEGRVTLFNVAEKTITFIEPDRGEHWTTTPKAVRDQAAEQLSRLDEMLKDLPEEQRELVRQQLKSAMGDAATPAKYKVEHTAETETIAGREATRYKIFRDGALHEELWIAPELDLSSELDTEAFREMTMEMAPASEQAGSRAVARALPGEGWPMRTVVHDAMGGTMVAQEITSVERRDLDAALFRVPAGSKAVDPTQ